MTIVINETAYSNAVDRYIKTNAAQTRRKVWEQDADYEAVRDFIVSQYSKASDGFWFNVGLGLQNWGAPSDKIKEIVRERIAQAAENKAKYAELDAKSQYIGQVKDRIVIDVTVTFKTYFEGAFGYVDISVLRDADGNVFVHKGTAGAWDKGDKIKLKATIKGHAERNGVKQTLITRPKII